MFEGQADVSDIEWIWHELAQNVRPQFPSMFYLFAIFMPNASAVVGQLRSIA